MKVSIPDVLKEFRIYHAKNPTWGSMHIVLADQNVTDRDVDFCIQYAFEKRDLEGWLLAQILRKMSKTQRRKLGMMIS